MNDRIQRLARRAAAGDLASARRLVSELEDRTADSERFADAVESMRDRPKVWIVWVNHRREEDVHYVFVRESDAWKHAADDIRDRLEAAYGPEDAEAIRVLPDRDVVMTWASDGADDCVDCFISVFPEPLRLKPGFDV